jgi:hypothetical protein
MTYFIFLKYLDSLEDFRKNPHIKIPPKSPPTNFQSPGIFKNQIVIRKRIFFSLLAQSAQRPAGPSGLSAQPWPIFFLFNRSFPSPPLPIGPRPLGRPSPPSWPSRPHVGGALADCRLPHGKMPHLTPPSPLSVPG